MAREQALMQEISNFEDEANEVSNILEENKTELQNIRKEKMQ